MMPNLNIFDHFEFLINFLTIWLTLYYLIYRLFNFEIFSDNLSSDKIDFKQIRQSYSVSYKQPDVEVGIKIRLRPPYPPPPTHTQAL